MDYKKATEYMETAGQFLVGGNTIAANPRTGFRIRRGMETTVKREDLLIVVRSNREKHQKTFEEAWEGYKKAIIKELETALEDAKKGVRIYRQTTLVQPISQLQEYDRAIKMLEMNTQAEITLEEHEFNQFVMDKWNWSKQFAMSNKSYTSSDIANSYINTQDS